MYFLVLVKSIIEIIQYSLKLLGVQYFLTEHVSQDCLESFFGQQCMRGGRNDNPSVQSCLESTSSLRIQGSQSLQPFRGNCGRRKLCTEDFKIDPKPLPKRGRTLTKNNVEYTTNTIIN